MNGIDDYWGVKGSLGMDKKSMYDYQSSGDRWIYYLYNKELFLERASNFDTNKMNDKSFKLVTTDMIDRVIEKMKKKLGLNKITYGNWLYIAKVYRYNVVKELEKM